MEKISERLEQIMAERRLKRGDIAQKLGVSATTVGNWIKGKKRHDKQIDQNEEEVQQGSGLMRSTFVPRGETLIELCRLLGINSNWLLTGEGEKYMADEARVIGSKTNDQQTIMLKDMEINTLRQEIDFLKSVIKTLQNKR